MVRGTGEPTVLTVGVAKVKPDSDGRVIEAMSAELMMPSCSAPAAR
jgi:hypothetical protein